MTNPSINRKYEGNPVSYVKSKEDEIILMMKRDGCLLPEIASFLNISYSCLRVWIRKYKEVKELLELGQTHSMAWWIRKGREALSGNSSFNFQVWSAMLKNNFGYGDHPSERAVDMEDWGGTPEEKIKKMDKLYRDGELSSDVYYKMMQSIYLHIQIIDGVVMHPITMKMKVELDFKDGKITKEEYDAKIEIIDRISATKESLIDIALRENGEELFSKFPKKSKDNIKSPAKGIRLNRRVELMNKAARGRPRKGEETQKNLTKKMKHIGIEVTDKKIESKMDVRAKREEKIKKLMGLR